MLSFPPAKINLGLNVVRRRADGYHDIRSVMVQIPLFDVLEIVVDENLQEGEVIHTRSGLAIRGDPRNDLCSLAIEEFRKFNRLPGLRVHLHKAIPMGAGLGGGSSDAAHTLMLLNKIFDLQLEQELPEIAARLGSDCPFFLNAMPQLAEGKGDELKPVTGIDLKGKWLMLVYPGIHVPTTEVYTAIEPTGTAIDLENIFRQPIGKWQNALVNDMERVVFAKHPHIGAIKERMITTGASYASMSGSGSTVYGIFEKEPKHLALPDDHKAWILQLT